jgi:two-component system OmpR family sensor kinase
MHRSLSTKLAVVALLFLLGGLVFRAVGHDKLMSLSQVSSEVRGRWLDTVRVLGRLNGHIALLRTEEAESLFRVDPQDPSGLDARAQAVEADIRDYQALPHDREELAQFDRFLGVWRQHQPIIETMEQRDQRADRAGLEAFFRGPAHANFQSLSASLRRLLDLTNIKADAARSALADAMIETRQMIGDLFIGSLLLFVLLAAYVWAFYSRPLLALAGLMRRLAQYDTAFELPYERRKDEVGDLARSLATFKENTIELLASRKALTSYSRNLAGTLEKERVLATRQRNFIQTMSHELRTPLTYIDGHAQRILATKDRATPVQTAERAQRIRLAGLQITRLVESLTGALDVLDQKTTRMEPTDIRPLLQEVVLYHGAIGVEGGVDLDIETGAELIVQGDPDLLRFAFSNLIGNAFKYSPERADVRLSACRVGSSIDIVIEDHGMGIPAAELSRVFEPYYRASNVQFLPGTGMGLHLVERIIHQHNGSLSVESEVGGGTRISVKLAARSSERPALETTDVQDTCNRG